MDWTSLLTAIALSSISVVAGGAAVRVAVLLGTLRAAVVLALVVAMVLSVVLGTTWSRERGSTPYWN